MDAVYPGHEIVLEKNRKRLQAWSRQDPPDTWEGERAKRIEQVQGNKNPFAK